MSYVDLEVEEEEEEQEEELHFFFFWIGMGGRWRGAVVGVKRVFSETDEKG